MKSLIDLKGNPEHKFAKLLGGPVLSVGGFHHKLSPVALIIYGMMEESKQDGILSRLQFKLGATKEEVYKMISEL